MRFIHENLLAGILVLLTMGIAAMVGIMLNGFGLLDNFGMFRLVVIAMFVGLPVFLLESHFRILDKLGTTSAVKYKRALLNEIEFQNGPKGAFPNLGVSKKELEQLF